MSEKYKLTCYCKACNGNNDNTKSGESAKVGKTVAVHPSLYTKKKGCKINIEGIGDRIIQDTHGMQNEKLIDIFVDCGKNGKCNCSGKENEKYNGYAKVTFEIKDNI